MSLADILHGGKEMGLLGFGLSLANTAFIGSMLVSITRYNLAHNLNNGEIPMKALRFHGADYGLVTEGSQQDYTIECICRCRLGCCCCCCCCFWAWRQK